MPNHTRNEITVLRGDVEAVNRLIRNEQGVIDFNVLIPMPKILGLTTSPLQTDEEGRYMLKENADDPLDFKTRPATDEEQAELDALPHKDWYSWANVNWGTKWGAYHTEPGDWEFDTAWDSPRPWMEALGEALPKGTVVEIISVFECGSPSEIVMLGSD